VTVPSNNFASIATVKVPTFQAPCHPTNIQIGMSLTSDVDLSTYTFAAVDVNYSWGGNDWLFPFTDGSRPAALTGTSMGSAGCTGLSFIDTAGAAFSTATPPYDGTFTPSSPFDSLQTGADADCQYDFYLNFSNGGNITLNCFVVQFDATPGLAP
jgi:hypothetical protein